MEEVFKASFDDSELVKKLEDLDRQISEIGEAAIATSKATTQAFAQATDATDEFANSLDKSADQVARQAASVNAARAANQTWLQSIRQTIAGQEIGGRSLSEWADSARAFASRISEGARAVQGATVAQRVFNGVLKASGIGLLITAIASLISYFTRFQSGFDKVSQVMAGFNAVVGVVLDRLALFGSALVKVFTGDFSGAANDATAAVTGFAGAVADAAVQAYNLEKRIQALRDITITQSVEAARARTELEKYRQIVDDGSASLGKRVAASREAAKIEQQLADQAVDRALEAQQIATAKFNLDRESLAAREEAAAAEIALQEAIQSRNSALFNAEKEQREFRKEAAAERKKQQEEEKKRIEEFQKLLDQVNKQAAALDVENTFDPVKKVEKEFALALNGVEDLQKRLLKLATTDSQREQVRAGIAKLFGEVIDKYNEELVKAKEEAAKLNERVKPFDPLSQANTGDDDLKFRAQSAIKKAQQAATDAINEQEPRSLAEILGISQEGLEGLKDATDRILDSLAQIGEARVKEAEAARQAADEKVRAAEEALEKEQELAKNGIANDTNLRKQQLAEAKKQREQALKEEAAARRSQILLDSAGQISSLLSASANIFKSLSNIPFAGIPLAIAAIGTMFAAFAKAKSDALKAASAPKLRKGGKLEGPAHEFGGVPVVVDGVQVAEAEGGEWVLNREASREHDAFLDRMNRGEYRGIDLPALVSGRRRGDYSTPLSESAPVVAELTRQRTEADTQAHYAAMVQAYREGATQIVEAIEGRPVVYPKGGYIEKVKKGNTTQVTNVSQD